MASWLHLFTVHSLGLVHHLVLMHGSEHACLTRQHQSVWWVFLYRVTKWPGIFKFRRNVSYFGMPFVDASYLLIFSLKCFIQQQLCLFKRSFIPKMVVCAQLYLRMKDILVTVTASPVLSKGTVTISGCMYQACEHYAGRFSSVILFKWNVWKHSDAWVMF